MYCIFSFELHGSWPSHCWLPLNLLPRSALLFTCLKIRKVKVAQSCPTLCDYTVRGILQTRILEWVAVPFSRGSSQPRDQTQVSPLQVASLLAEPPGKPKNTGVGSLSLLQGIFLIQESNQGFLYCRQILYQLSYEAILCPGDEPDHPYILISYCLCFSCA